MQLLPSQLETQLELAQKENNLYYYKEILGIGFDFLQSIISLRGVGRLSDIADAKQRQAQTDADFKEWMKENNVYETDTYQYDSKGKVKSRTRHFARKRKMK